MFAVMKRCSIPGLWTEPYLPAS